MWKSGKILYKLLEKDSENLKAHLVQVGQEKKDLLLIENR